MNPFIRIKYKNDGNIKDGYYLDTSLLEKEMENHTGGINLSSLNFSCVDTQYLKKFVPFFEQWDHTDINNLTNKYLHINSPCAMKLNSADELSEHMKNIYQISFFHYILGKKFYHNFPKMCCSKSTKNVVLSLIDSGYPNAALVHASEFDHAYAILPFILNNEIKGSVIVDPTYDQFEFNKNQRNPVFVRLGSDWKYEEPTAGKSLYPGIVCSIDSIKQSNLNSIAGHHNGREYFEKAFLNPIKLN